MFVFKAVDYVDQYQDYSSVWLTNQTDALSVFLTYGRDIFPDESESLQFETDEQGIPLVTSSPKLSDFKIKVQTTVIKYFFTLTIQLYLD